MRLKLQLLNPRKVAFCNTFDIEILLTHSSLLFSWHNLEKVNHANHIFHFPKYGCAGKILKP